MSNKECVDEKTLSESTVFQPTYSFVHPHEWPRRKKWLYTAVVAYCDCLTFLVSMMLAPGVPQVLQTFRPHGGDEFLGSFCVTVYILGFCVGPLLLGPLTDLYGRTVMLRTCILFFLALTIACALSTSLGMLIAFRFLAGIFGGAPMAIGGAAVADMYLSGERGRPIAWYSYGTMLGPTLGPVLGGIINGTLGWRWIFWIAAILAGICAVGLFFILHETHLPTLVTRSRDYSSGTKVQRLLARYIPKNAMGDNQSILSTLSRAVLLPVRLTFSHPSIAAILLLILIFNGVVNIVLSSLGSVYQKNYHFSRTTAGLSYLGMGFGGLSALATASRISDYLARCLNGQETPKQPEHHIPLIIVTLPVAMTGLLWYGWACKAHVHWFVPIMGLFLFGYAYMSIRLSTQLFLVEAVPNYSASALAAHTVASSIGGAFIPLSAFPMYNSLGYGWGNTLIALLELSLLIIPLALFISTRRTGKHVRIHL
ncbi:putative bicyclomycin resistance protein [Tothia fuscella]|uniref:Bicyclomycin resistance protein n=1 Tax=Tothia fuscella TaxID=1048955 RepID=A0A9P4TUY5_9PEZI|nr:putative bicyclomycin resistance protein [Tothia fuscella]